MTDSNSQDELLTLDEVSALLKCSKNAIYELTRQRSRASKHPIPVMRLPFGLRFRRDAIMKWLAEVEQSGWSYTVPTFNEVSLSDAELRELVLAACKE